MKKAKLIFGLIGASGIALLGWLPHPDIFEQWLITGSLTLLSIYLAGRSVEDFTRA